jgi:phosphate transport system substrate-binding protein
MARLAAAAAVMSVAAGAMAQVEVDTQIPAYQKVQGVSGSIRSIGSDTMNQTMTMWAEEFARHYPSVKIEIEGKGSSTAPPALIEGQAQFGPMSREMKASEIDEFERKFGYKPVALEAGVDALAVYVHKDCPLDSITLEQVKNAFSVAGPDVTWGNLGVAHPQWKDRPIALYGRNSASGTYGFFKEHALKKNDFKPTVREQAGSSAVVQAVASDRFGMGYSGLGYKTADVKALKVAGADGKTVEANAENAYSGEYPLARYLYVYVNRDPRRELDPLRREFVRMMFSREGQEAVIKSGYFPATVEMARENLAEAGIRPWF